MTTTDMITIREIHTADSCYAWVESLMTDTFPEDERRDATAQRVIVDSEPRYKCCLAEDDGKCIGLFGYWDFCEFVYCEHFAIASRYRNQGYGSYILQLMNERLRRPMVLEVEQPINDISKRRISFYARHGFCLWEDVAYTQPPYRSGGSLVPMMLMATTGLDASCDYERVRTMLYRHVYGIA